MSWRRTILAGVVGALAIGLALPAIASASGSSCPDGKLCVWSRADYKGKRLKIGKVNDADNKIYRKMNDRVTSVKNRWDFRADLFADIVNIPDLALGYDFNNVASSAYLWPDSETCV
jgi:hypothetical protein